MNRFFKDKRVLVTGGCGTIGSQLVHRLATGEDRPAEIVVLDSHEESLFLLDYRYAASGNVTCLLGDVRDLIKMREAMHGIDVVFHTAAFKHVLLCERSPFEAVQTNILGVQNVISASLEAGVNRVVFTSSDKAVNPTNVMGTSKLMGERLISAANTYRKAERTVFSSVRFGNVLGSSGSVIPVFHGQIRNGGPVTLTDSDMTRFVMSVDQAVQLILDATSLARGGEIFVPKMPVARIRDIAHVMTARLAPEYGHDPEHIEVQIIGAKAGEKMYEELMSDEEKGHSLELEKHYVVLPALRGIYRFISYDYDDMVSSSVEKAYNSANVAFMSLGELGEFLDAAGLLRPSKTPPEMEFDHRSWPGD